MKKILENKLYIFILSLPALVLFSGFVLYPMLYSGLMSLQKTDGLTKATFAGISNFIRLFTDEAFLRANSASFGLSLLAVIFNALLATAVAVLVCGLDTKIQFFLRTAFMIPLVLSISVISQLWLTIYHADWGMLNQFLRIIGLGFLQNEWLINPKTAMICVAVVGMWWMFGMDFLMISSAIESIPAQYFEAAQLDGAGLWQIISTITLPLILPVLKTCVTISAIGGLFTFPQVFIMTGGGPGNLTQTVMMYMYRQAFSNQRYGMAAAVGVIVILETCILLGLIGVLFKKLGCEEIEASR